MANSMLASAGRAAPPSSQPPRADRDDRDGAPAGPRRWIAAPDVLLFLAATLVYVTALPNQFAQDDFYYLVESDEVRNHPWILFITPFRDSGIYRPLTLLTLGANYALGELEPLGFHLFNVLLHGVVTILLYRLFRQLAGA